MKVKNLALDERPMKFDDVIGQDLIVKNLSAQSRSNKFFQSYLLYGHYGCGKTTTARILAAAINCRNKDENGNPCGVCPHCLAVKQGCVDMVEIDGASNTGIDSIRQLKETVEYLPTTLDKKIYIIDEVHKLSDAAFNALLKVLEEPPAHVVFILATTDRDKIPSTVLSRLAKYEFRRIPTNVLVAHLKKISERNGYIYTDDGLATIARNSDGSVRNSIKMLEIVSELDGGVTEENAVLMIGLADPATVYALLELLMKGDSVGAFYMSADLMDSGWDPRRLTNEMINVCSDAILGQERLDLVDASDQYKALLKNLCVSYCTERIIVVLDFLMSLAKTLREAVGDRGIFKNGILLFANNSENRLSELERQVKELEEKLQHVLNGGVTVANTTAKTDVSEEHASEETSVLAVSCEKEPAQAATDSKSIAENEVPRDEDLRNKYAEEESVENQGKECASSNASKSEKVVPDIDPFAIFSGFSFSSSTMTMAEKPEQSMAKPVYETDCDKETEEDSDSIPAAGGDEDAFIFKVEQEEPVLDNLLSLGFIPLKDGETTVFETDEPAFYRMGKAFAGALDGFPFGLRKAK